MRWEDDVILSCAASVGSLSVCYSGVGCSMISNTVITEYGVRSNRLINYLSNGHFIVTIVTN
jgi:hypothetical protein